MKVLVLHNFYQSPGGEDVVVASEVALLKSRGHQVVENYVTNDDIDSPTSKIKALLGAIFSPKQYSRIRRLLREHRPDVLHVHNFFPLISPAFVYAANHEKVPIVMTLHNYRTVCPTVVLMHQGKIVEASLDNGPWWALKHRVYKDSYIGTLALCLMIWIHRKIGTWHRIARLIALTPFARSMFTRAGIASPEKIVVKPNFIDFSETETSITVPKQPFALYVGRMSPEKGVDVFFHACKQSKHHHIVITPRIEMTSDAPNNVEILTNVLRKDILGLMQHATCVVVPSTCYEGFPMVIVEAFATRTPVVCSALGGLPEIVRHGETGLHFPAGNATKLAEQIDYLITHQDKAREMGEAALADYESLYRPSINAEQLEAIYTQACAEINRS